MDRADVIHTRRGCYLPTTEKEVLPFFTTWMNLEEDLMLSETDTA